MAVSTERTVRDVLVAAIRGVAGQLGFSEPGGNVREYPIEWHQDEQLEAYLKALVSLEKRTERQARAWAVDVLGYDEPWTMNLTPKRTYSISVISYYAKGVGGAGYLDLIDHARIVRGAINALGPTLDGTVTRVLGASQLSVSETAAARDKLLVGVMTYSAERTRPDF